VDWSRGKRKGQKYYRFLKMGWRIPYKRWWVLPIATSDLSQCLLPVPFPTQGRHGFCQKPAKIQVLKTFLKFCLLYLKTKCGRAFESAIKHSVVHSPIFFLLIAHLVYALLEITLLPRYSLDYCISRTLSLIVLL
jgi:hypothetical protein